MGSVTLARGCRAHGGTGHPPGAHRRVRLDVYIAGRFERRAQLRGWRAALEADNGVVVESSWLDEPPEVPRLPADPTHCRRAVVTDLSEIDAADIFLMDHTVPGGEGRFMELGYALGRGRALVVIVGARDHPFYWHPRVVVLPDLQAALAYLRAARASTRP